MKNRINREKELLPDMIAIYCRGVHKTKKGELCAECRELCDFALNRLSKCRYGENKTFCSQCPTHCYRPDMREKIRQVMRYSGPRILLKHPIAGTLHAVSTMKGIIAKKKGAKS